MADTNNLFLAVMCMVAKVIKLEEYPITPHVYTKFDSITEELLTQFTNTLAKKSNFAEVELVEARRQMWVASRCSVNDYQEISTHVERLNNYCSRSEKRNILKLLIVVAFVSDYCDKKEAMIYEAGQSFNFRKIQIQDFINEVIVESKEKDVTNLLQQYGILCCKKINIFTIAIGFVKNIFSNNLLLQKLNYFFKHEEKE